MMSGLTRVNVFSAAAARASLPAADAPIAHEAIRGDLALLAKIDRQLDRLLPISTVFCEPRRFRFLLANHVEDPVAAPVQ